MTERFDLYLNTPALGVLHAGDVAVKEEQGLPQQVGFRYRPDYLDHPAAFPIDPVQLPLQAKEFAFNCRNGVPAFIDDYLPDAWGRRILTRLASIKFNKRFNAHSIIETLSLMGNSHIGAIRLVKQGADPQYGLGAPLSELPTAAQMAKSLMAEQAESLDMEKFGLLYLAHSGTGVGGARPKALLYDKKHAYLAKFNHSRDDYNNAKVELACLNMAQSAGLETAAGHLTQWSEKRDVLLLSRFDVVADTQHARHHMVTANGLLKHPATQQDAGPSFRYDDLCQLIRRYSYQVAQDMKQLLRLMLFNVAINNTDDHERNFSFLHDGKGYRLAPAYDMVPSLMKGSYHAAGFDYLPDPPTVTTVLEKGRVFGLSKPEVATIAHEVAAAIDNWPKFAADAGLNVNETKRISTYFRCS